MKVKFCGAAREVTGSAHLITLDDGYKILLDCGMYQGGDERVSEFNSRWEFDPTELDCVILSHAHIDHSGRLPKLVKDGFSGDILSTHATRSLCSIMLLDSAKIQEYDAEYLNDKKVYDEEIKPLYTREDVSPCMDRFVTYGYNHWYTIRKGVNVLFRDSGHILGSASVSLRIEEDEREIRLGFTGDIGRPDRPILRDPQTMPELHYLISESTYGNREHPGKPQEDERMLGIIRKTCVEKGGKLIIPAFSVGRTQEIVFMLDKLENEGRLPEIPVYVDSPLATNATAIYGSHPECYDDQLNEYLLEDDDPFGFNRLHYVRSAERSKMLNESDEACIIISAAGMMNAGRIRHHMFHQIGKPENTFLIVGYCAPGTDGRRLRDGVRQIRIFGQTVQVRAEIQVMDSFSAHGDYHEMLDYLAPLKESLQKIFLVHGDFEAQESFRDKLYSAGYKSVKIPQLGDEAVLEFPNDQSK